LNLYEDHPSIWLSGNLFETISRCSVPVFVMISGSLLLSSEKPILYMPFLKKRTGKIFFPLLGWSFIYYLYNVFSGGNPFSITDFGRLFLTDGISVHFWFMYMILGLYLVTPLVKILVNNASKKDLQYFLLLWVMASVIFKLIEFLIGIAIQLELYFVTNYVGYFILGYFLSKYELSQRVKWLSYIGAICGLIMTFFFTYYDTVDQKGALAEFWYEYHSPNVLLVSIGVFVLFKDIFRAATRPLPKVINIINTSSFGIYLVHLLVMKVFSPYIFNYTFYNWHSIISIPVNVLITVMISSAIVLVMKRIPLINRLVP